MDLGALIVTNRTRGLRLAVITACVASLVACGVALALIGNTVVARGRHDPDRNALTLAFIAAAAATALAGPPIVQALRRWWPNPTMSLHERGVVYERGARRLEVAWDALDELRYRVAQFGIVIARTSWVTYAVTLRAGSTTVAFSESLACAPAVLAAARKALLHNRLPAMIERLNAGETIAIGDERVHREGLQLAGKQIAWRDITDVDVRAGLVCVSGTRNVSRYVYEIPNVDLFIALCKVARTRWVEAKSGA